MSNQPVATADLRAGYALLLSHTVEKLGPYNTHRLSCPKLQRRVSCYCHSKTAIGVTLDPQVVSQLALGAQHAWCDPPQYLHCNPQIPSSAIDVMMVVLVFK